MRSVPTYENMDAKLVMNKVNAPSMPFDWSLNPYRGCTHGCSFCYARSTHGFLGMEVDDTFRNHVLVKQDAARILEEQLTRKLKRADGDYERLAADIGLLAIGTATDPYQSIEAQRQITRECLTVLCKYQIPTTITTRSPLILRDIDVLTQMNVQSIHISIHTMKTDVWRLLEPASPAPMKRLETVRKLKEAGLPVDVFLAPIIPCLTDSVDDLREVIAAAVQHDADSVWPSVLRLGPDVKEWFIQVLRDVYPHLVGKLECLYRTSYPPKWYVDPLMQNVNAILQEFGISVVSKRHRMESLKSEVSTVSTTTKSLGSQEGNGNGRFPVLSSTEQLRLPI